MKFIVTAGGQGTKLWPLSRNDKPKQFQTIIGNQSLFSYNVDLLLRQYKPSDIYISTKKKYLSFALDQAPNIPHENFIIEPDVKKDRGPAEGLAFVHMLIKHADEPFMLIQSDCIREPYTKYLLMLKEAEKLAKRDRLFITGGVKATYPILGIDYIKLGLKAAMQTSLEVYRIEEFIPRVNDYNKTKDLIENFYIVTHSNCNCWYPGLMLEAYKRYRPDWYENLMKIKTLIEEGSQENKIEKIYEEMKEGPTELVTKHIFNTGYAFLLPYKWIDIGSWNSLYENLAKKDEVYTDGNVINLGGSKTLIKGGSKNKLIATIGLNNMVVVDTDDVLFISTLEELGKIQELHKLLNKEGHTHLL